MTLHPNFKVSRRAPHEHALAKAAGGGPWTVPALCAAYNFPNGTAPGTTKPLAIIECGGGYTAADVTTFFSGIGQPEPTIANVNGDLSNSPGQEADMEVALDIQVLAAAYYYLTGKVANLRMYWYSDIGAGVAQAAKDGCAVLSCSWGQDEAGWGTAAVEAMQASAAAAVEAGMIVFAAAGDNDADDSDGTGKPSVDCPASCPSVVGCGGTTKTPTSEVVWNNSSSNDASGEGTGGGFSTVFPVQAWQVGAPTPPAGLGRLVPDLAANADPNTGYEIVQGGQSQVVGGTSAVAPLMAALFAAIGASGNVLTKVWSNPGDFTDITSGTNGLYAAAKGPDACSGVGSPIGTKLAATFAPSAPAPAPTPTPAPTPPPTHGPSGVLTAAQVTAVMSAIDAVIDPDLPLLEKTQLLPALASAIAALGPVVG